MATRTEVSLICPALASRSFLSIFTLCSCSLSRLCVIRLISYRHTFDFLSRHVMAMDECKHVHQRCLFPSACPIPGESTQRHLTTNEKNPPVGLHENLLFCSLSAWRGIKSIDIILTQNNNNNKNNNEHIQIIIICNDEYLRNSVDGSWWRKVHTLDCLLTANTWQQKLVLASLLSHRLYKKLIKKLKAIFARDDWRFGRIRLSVRWNIMNEIRSNAFN